MVTTMRGQGIYGKFGWEDVDLYKCCKQKIVGGPRGVVCEYRSYQMTSLRSREQEKQSV